MHYFGLLLRVFWHYCDPVLRGAADTLTRSLLRQRQRDV
jgi:hypothetical protein